MNKLLCHKLCCLIGGHVSMIRGSFAVNIEALSRNSKSIKTWRIGKIIFLAAVIFSITAALLLSRSAPKKLFIAGHKFKIELADSEEERRIGLSQRNRPSDDYAMLFLFPAAGQHGFWMKGMKFPLDILWISGDNKVVYIEKNISPEFKGTLNPPVMADKVVEINAKLSDKYGLKIGDEVFIK